VPVKITQRFCRKQQRSDKDNPKFNSEQSIKSQVMALKMTVANTNQHCITIGTKNAVARIREFFPGVIAFYS